MTVTSRAALARTRRQAAGAAGRAVAKDPCPHCGAELGRAHGVTRRVALFSSTRGVFRWRCPDCREAWSEAASGQAQVSAGARTRNR